MSQTSFDLSVLQRFLSSHPVDSEADTADTEDHLYAKLFLNRKVSVLFSPIFLTSQYQF